MDTIYDVCGALIWMEPGGPIMLKAIDGTDPIELNADEARKIGETLIALAGLEDHT